MSDLANNMMYVLSSTVKETCSPIYPDESVFCSEYTGYSKHHNLNFFPIWVDWESV